MLEEEAIIALGSQVELTFEIGFNSRLGLLTFNTSVIRIAVRPQQWAQTQVKAASRAAARREEKSRHSTLKGPSGWVYNSGGSSKIGADIYHNHQS